MCPVLKLAYLAFFVSGFAALSFQVIWQRLLGVFSGSDVHSATIVVAAFMAGLGCGSLVGGRVADRVTPRMSLALFVLAELAIAVFGYFSIDLYYGTLYARLGHVALGPGTIAAVLFVGLLWPTFFMGLSLPLLTRGLTTAIGHAARVAGSLYGSNTLGAAVGAMTATWVLLPVWGLEGTVLISAALNVLVAAIAAPVALGWRTSRTEDLPLRPRTDAAGPGSDQVQTELSYPALLLLSGLSGFVALSFEIVWFRLLGVMLKSSAFTFGTLLAVYLAGIGLGAAAAVPWLHRCRRPARLFVALQVGIGLYAGATLTLLVSSLGNTGPTAKLFRYFGSYDPLDAGAAVGWLAASATGAGSQAWQLFGLYLGLPILIVGPPTLLMGVAFPLLQRAVQRDPARVGTRLGATLASNIAGSTLGSLVTGLVWLSWLGTAGTLKLLVGISALFPLIWLFRNRVAGASLVLRYGRGAAVVAAVAAVVAVIPEGQSLWTRLHGTRPGSLVVGEDASGTFALRKDVGNRSFKVVVFANGLGQSWIPYGGIHTVLGALPAFIHEDPRDALVIGLGSGDTLFGMAGRTSLARITCVEIVRPQLETLKVLSRQWPDPGLLAVLNDPRISHVYGDGRVHIARGGRQFDIIEADALRPTSSYSGNLYSTAYFELLRRHLKPGGLAVTWSPTERIHNSFLKVFPHVLSFGSIVLGSNEPIVFDRDALRARLADPDVRRHYMAAGIPIGPLLAPYLDSRPGVYGPEFDRSTLADVNTDLFPKDEFSGMRRLLAAVFGGSLGGASR